MNGLLPEIQNRFSCRRYIPGKTLELPQINLLLEAAGRAPSGCNRQPWRFIVVQDSAKIEKIASLSYGQSFLKDASVVFVVVGDVTVRDPEYTRKRLDDLETCKAFSAKEINTILVLEGIPSSAAKDEAKVVRDCAISAHSLMLQATHMGLGSCWVSIKEKGALKSLCGIPPDDNLIIVCALAVGHPENTATKQRPRFPIEQFSFEETYGKNWRKS